MSRKTDMQDSSECINRIAEEIFRFVEIELNLICHFRDWTVVRIPIGKVDEVFRLNVCIYTLYIAAIERIWLENCTAMEGKKSRKSI